MKIPVILVIASLLCTIVALSISPSCRKIETDKMVTPLNLEKRTDTTGIYPLRFSVFTKKDNHWYQCKMRISRLFSF